MIFLYLQRPPLLKPPPSRIVLTFTAAGLVKLLIVLNLQFYLEKNTSPASIHSITGILPFKTTAATAKYLGLPFIIGKSKKEAFQAILARVHGKIDGWRAKTLSQAGRTVLIKATTSSIPSYTMSTFLLPKSLCATLDKCFKDFWWGFPKGKTRNLSLKSWRSICIPVILGVWAFEICLISTLL